MGCKGQDIRKCFVYGLFTQLDTPISQRFLPGAQSKVRVYTMLVPIGENVTLFSDFSLEIFDPFL